jgi:hypothetical protein
MRKSVGSTNDSGSGSLMTMTWPNERDGPGLSWRWLMICLFVWFRKAVVHRHRGESADAENCWRRILGLHRPDQFCSFDQGIYGHLTRRNLAALSNERGDHAEARRLWSEVLAECPGDREALAKLGRVAEKSVNVGSG